MTPQTLSKIHAAVMPQADEASFVAMHEALARRSELRAEFFTGMAELHAEAGNAIRARIYGELAAKAETQRALSLGLILCAKTGGVL